MCSTAAGSCPLLQAMALARVRNAMTRARRAQPQRRTAAVARALTTEQPAAAAAVGYGGPVLDAHVHIFDCEALSYPWLKGPQQVPRHIVGDIDPIRRSYPLSELRADAAAAGVDVRKWVHVQAECADALGEAAMVQRVADASDAECAAAKRAKGLTVSPAATSVGICAHANFAAADDKAFDAHLDALSRHRSVRGIRQLLNWHTDPALRFTDSGDHMTNSTWQRRFTRLSRFGWSFELQIYAAHQLEPALALLRKFPDTRFALNHTGMALDRDPPTLELWRRNMTALAAAPNLHVKISGTGMVDHAYTAASLRPFALHTVHAFGVDRVMFGSNFPVDKVVATYGKTVHTLHAALTPDLNAQEMRKIFHDNAQRFYRMSA